MGVDTYSRLYYSVGELSFATRQYITLHEAQTTLRLQKIFFPSSRLTVTDPINTFPMIYATACLLQ